MSSPAVRKISAI